MPSHRRQSGRGPLPGGTGGDRHRYGHGMHESPRRGLLGPAWLAFATLVVLIVSGVSAWTLASGW